MKKKLLQAVSVKVWNAIYNFKYFNAFLIFFSSLFKYLNFQSFNVINTEKPEMSIFFYNLTKISVNLLKEKKNLGLNKSLQWWNEFYIEILPSRLIDKKIGKWALIRKEKEKLFKFFLSFSVCKRKDMFEC